MPGSITPMDHLSDSSDSKGPEMTDLPSFVDDENDISRKTRISGTHLPQSLETRLIELYDKNITAKILRAARTCLENNVRKVHLIHFTN